MSKSNKKRRRNFPNEVSAFFNSADFKSAFASIQHDKVLLARSEFWNHSDCKSFCFSFSEAGTEIEVLAKGYASQPVSHASWDDSILKHFLSLDSKGTLEVIRYHKLFLLEPVFTILKDWLLLQTESEFSDLLEQFEFLYKAKRSADQELEKTKEAIAKYEWIDLLSLLAIWWEDFYAKLNLMKPPERPFLHPFMGEIVSIAIRAKIKSGGEAPEWDEPMPLMERFMHVLEACKNPSFWKPFEKLMKRLEAFVQLEQFLDSFAWQGHQLIILDENRISVVPQSVERETRWQKVGQQYAHLEDFFRRVGMKVLPPEHRGMPGFVEPLNPGHQIRWKQIGIPEELEFKGKKIELGTSVLFLTALGSFHQSRYFDKFNEVYPEAVQSRDPFPTRKAIEGGIYGTILWPKPMMGPLNITKIDYMVNRVLGKIHFHQPMDQKNLEAAVDFLALDIPKCSPDFDFQFQNFPFLRFGKVVFYFTSNLVIGNPSVLFQNRIFHYAKWLRKKKRNGKLMEEISWNFEEQVRWLFEGAGFETAKNIKLKDDDGNEITEIDVLVRKGNEILIIQAKSTFSRYQIKSIEEYIDTLDYAGHQTDLSIDCIRNAPQAFLDRFKLDIDPDDLIIHGLVVSSTQEGNYQRFGKGQFRKVSAFDLGILLGNHKWELFDWEFEALVHDLGSREAAHQKFESFMTGDYMSDPFGPRRTVKAAQFRQQKKLNKWISDNCDTWQKEEPSIARLMERINEDWLWEDVIHLKQMEFPSDDDPQHIKEAFRQYQYGMIHYRNGEFEEAIPFLKKAHELDINDVEYMGQYIDAVAESGKKKEAIELYGKQIELFPDAFPAYQNRAFTWMELGDYEKALADYEKAHELNPEHVDVFLTVLSLRSHLDLEIDLKDFDRMIRLGMLDLYLIGPHFHKLKLQLDKLAEKPNHSIEDLMTLSLLYLYRFDRNKAIAYLNKVLEREPNHIEALYNRGWFKVIQDLKETALVDFQKVIELDPNHANAWDQIGSIELAYGNTIKSMEAYLKALEIQPEFPRAFYNFGVLLVVEGKFDEAIKWLKKAVPDQENGISALMKLGEIFDKAENWEAARTVYQEAVDRGYDHAFTNWANAEMKIQKGGNNKE